MSLRKALRRKSGVTAVKGGSVQIPVNPEDLVDAIHQVQETVNALSKRVNDNVALFNAHTHSANDTAVIAGQREVAYDGTAVADQSLFTPLP